MHRLRPARAPSLHEKWAAARERWRWDCSMGYQPGAHATLASGARPAGVTRCDEGVRPSTTPPPRTQCTGTGRDAHHTRRHREKAGHRTQRRRGKQSGMEDGKEEKRPSPQAEAGRERRSWRRAIVQQMCQSSQCSASRTAARVATDNIFVAKMCTDLQT